MHNKWTFPNRNKNDNVKDVFYNELTETYDVITGNVVNIVLGDFSAMCGRERQYFFFHKKGKHAYTTIDSE